jgi:hypothetical protein
MHAFAVLHNSTARTTTHTFLKKSKEKQLSEINRHYQDKYNKLFKKLQKTT